MGRILGLDIGEKRTGLAITDDSKTISQAFDFTVSKNKIIETIIDLAKNYEIELVVIGLPTSMSGEEGRQAGIIRKTGERIKNETNIEIEYFDERLTTVQAKQLSNFVNNIPIDCLSAQIILEQYLKKTKT